MKKLLALLSVVGLTATSGAALVSCGPEKNIVNLPPGNVEVGDLSSLMRQKIESLNAFNSKISQIDPKIIGVMTFLDIKNEFPIEFNDYINANIMLQERHIDILVDENKSVTYNPQNEPIFTNLNDLPKEESEWCVDMTYSEVHVPTLMNEKFEDKLFDEKQIESFDKMSNKLSRLFGEEFEKHEIASYIYLYANDWMIIEQKRDVMAEIYGDEFKENILTIKDKEPEFVKQYVRYFADVAMLESNTSIKTRYFIGGTEMNRIVVEKNSDNIEDQNNAIDNLIPQLEMFVNGEFKEFIDEELFNELDNNYKELKELKIELD